MRMPTQTKKISLNLILDYPVKWSKYKVLRDFIQNFYDALGHKKWHQFFEHQLNGETLKLTAQNTGFSYDWLVHIGASTKRENEGTYAGYFGEGFKIASLCAIRDHKWRVRMASRDWELKVTTANVTVDGQQLTTLAYKLYYFPVSRDDTILVLDHFLLNDQKILHAALLSFYYRENPLFGELIWESSQSAIYYRSKQPLPDYYPSTYREKGKGIVFAAYQAAGTFPYPLVICQHHYRSSDRERNTFYKMDVIDLLKDVSYYLPAEAALKVLLVFKNKWYSYPEKRYDFESYYQIVQRLISCIASSKEITAIFKQQYPNLLVARAVHRRDLAAYNRRRQALVWLKDFPIKYRLAQDGFLKMGYATLEEECERNNGFNLVRQPTEYEKQFIEILEGTVEQLFPGFFGSGDLPPCKVILNEEGVWAGMTTCLTNKNPEENYLGIKIKYSLPYVAIKSGMLQNFSFGAALSTYLHELAHMFGGDRSASFGHAMTEILDITLRKTSIIAQMQLKWEKCPDHAN